MRDKGTPHAMSDLRRHQGKRPQFWSKTLPDGAYDDIVIGSGMGGMTTAAFLAKLGRRVLVLEQHYVPGGFTHTFRRKGYRWDVGVHAVGEVTPHSMTGRLLAQLTGGLEWRSLGPVYDEFHYPEGFRIDFPDSPQQFRANLIEAFPDQEASIDRYLDVVRDVAAAMKNYYVARTTPNRLAPLLDRTIARRAQKYLTQSTKEIIDGLTDDERLRIILTSQWGYYGSPPARSSFAMQALVAKHFMWGGYYPVGGSQEIARGLLKTVADAGGWTVVNGDVEQILIEGGRAVGVRLTDGRTARAKRVVSAAGVQSTVTRLLPPEHRDAQWSRGIEKLPPAPAHVCLYLGFKGDIREAGATAANKWFYEVWSSEAETWRIEDPMNPGPAPILYTSFPSLKDPTHDPGPELRHTGEVVTFIPWEDFERWKDTDWKKRGEDYDAFKDVLAERLKRQLLEHMPELEPMIDYAELSTPLSTDHFVRPMAGSIYGLEPTPERFENPWLRPRSPIDGLFMSGSEVATVGVIGAMMGGVLCAAAAEPLGAFNLMRRL